MSAEKKRAAIQIEHHSAHPPSVIWRALTDPTLHARWWAEGDIRPIAGHRFELNMGPFGKQPCEVLAAEPEKLLQYRFAPGTLDTVLSWHLAPERSGTLLILTHEGFDLESPLGRRAYEGMKPNWPMVLARLEKALDGLAPTPSSGH